jgi:hypothetical protein
MPNELAWAFLVSNQMKCLFQKTDTWPGNTPMQVTQMTLGAARARIVFRACTTLWLAINSAPLWK